ncbi:class F sortase [Cryptosporangium minutisporangium]|uniref:Class F sortase n=1 Tax=Cryptosporangium minutisporangium TaxID=113569 RepID=A0ABP6T560_9ACTN
MRRPAAVVFGVGILLVLVAVSVFVVARDPAEPPTTEGAAAAERLATEAPAPPATTARAAQPITPQRLRIPGIGVDATVLPVGVEAATGEMEVPRAVDRVGWYRYGPALDAPAGSMVIAGHVDDASQGPGAFFELRDLGIDDRLVVTGTDGTDRRYRVVAREVFDKSAVPLDRLFSRDGAPRLTLVTCGGSFDRAARSYRDNVVVTAVEEAGR